MRWMALAPLLLLAAPAGAQPSFNCNRAATYSERAVCADVGLSALDRELAATFGAAMAAASPAERDGLERGERAWVASRDRCVDAADGLACIAESYRRRIAEFQRK